MLVGYLKLNYFISLVVNLWQNFKVICSRTNFERKDIRVNARTLVAKLFYDDFTLVLLVEYLLLH